MRALRMKQWLHATQTYAEKRHHATSLVTTPQPYSNGVELKRRTCTSLVDVTIIGSSISCILIIRNMFPIFLTGWKKQERRCNNITEEMPMRLRRYLSWMNITIRTLFNKQWYGSIVSFLAHLKALRTLALFHVIHFVDDNTRWQTGNYEIFIKRLTYRFRIHWYQS